LDKDFTSLVQSESLLSLLRPKKETLKALLSKGSSKGLAFETNPSILEKAVSAKVRHSFISNFMVVDLSKEDEYSFLSVAYIVYLIL